MLCTAALVGFLFQELYRSRLLKLRARNARLATQRNHLGFRCSPENFQDPMNFCSQQLQDSDEEKDQ